MDPASFSQNCLAFEPKWCFIFLIFSICALSGCFLLAWTHVQSVLPARQHLPVDSVFPAWLSAPVFGKAETGAFLPGQAHHKHSLLWELTALLAAWCFLSLTTQKSLLPPLLAQLAPVLLSVRQWFLHGLFLPVLKSSAWRLVNV